MFFNIKTTKERKMTVTIYLMNKTIGSRKTCTIQYTNFPNMLLKCSDLLCLSINRFTTVRSKLLNSHLIVFYPHIYVYQPDITH